MTLSRFLQRRIQDKREDQDGGPSFGSKGPRRLGVAVNDLIYGGAYFNFLIVFFFFWFPNFSGCAPDHTVSCGQIPSTHVSSLLSFFFFFSRVIDIKLYFYDKKYFCSR